VPRELTPDQKRALCILSRHVVTQLELRRHALELAQARKERENILNDLRSARAELAKIRRNLPPKKASREKGKRQ
jgi:hypothetical protein